MSWLSSPWSQLGVVAAKASLMYVTALVGLRLGERRTVAQWTLMDFAAAVAVGAILGRTAIASTQSYATGAVALLTLIVLHRLVSAVRFLRLPAKLTDHRVRVLVAGGQVRRGQLRLCGLTESDLFAELRLLGVLDLSRVRYVLYESKGGLSVVPASGGPLPPLAADGLRVSTGHPPLL